MIVSTGVFLKSVSKRVYLKSGGGDGQLKLETASSGRTQAAAIAITLFGAA